MGKDIKIVTDDINFKFRVSGILIVDNKLLTVQIGNNGFYCLPGGHVKLGEDTKQAVIREFEEETGINVSIKKLMFITENFFGKYHEIGYYYLLTPVNDVATTNYISKEVDGDMTLEFKWMELNNIQNFKPEFIKEEIKKDNDCIKHIIIREDKIC